MRRCGHRKRSCVIHISHLTKLYGSVIGVNDVSVQFARGAHGLLGPNGAGKTTFLGLMTGQLRPTMGRVEVFGESPFANPRVLRRIGYCPAADLVENQATAQAWVEHLVRLSGFSGADVRRRTSKAIEQVGLGSASRRPVATLSKGMRQRVKLAGAIAHDPDLLVLDEPFIGLDPVARHELVHLVRGWSRDRSLIVASHLLHEVEALDAGLAVILGGRLVASGTSAEIRDLIDSLPTEVRVRCSPPQKFAERAWRSDGVETVRIEGKDIVVIATRAPASLAEVVQEAAIEGLAISEVSPADRTLEGVFGRLVQLHRGIDA